MKKVLAWASIFMSACMVFGVAACGNDPTTGDDPSDNTGEGGHVHVADTFGSDEDMHWKVCTDCKETFIEEDHKYNGSNVCTECGYTIPETVGLEFELDTETDTYSVEGIGTAGDVETLYIPAYHDGKKVTEIGYGAFRGCSFESFTIPDGVTKLEAGTFTGCANLTSVDIPASVTELGYDMFSECNKLKNIVYKGSVDEWKALAAASEGWDDGTMEITITITCNNGTLTKEAEI